MTPRHRVSRAAIDLLKRFEGFRARAVVLPDGRWTVGYSHVLTAREGVEVSEADAESLLIYDLIGVAHLLNEAIFAPLTQNQFDALCSFVFNIGPENFRASAVLLRLNEGAAVQAACSLEMWRKAQVGDAVIVVDALVRRRAAEKALFLTPTDDDWIAAPSSILLPMLDEVVAKLVPAQAPEPVAAVVEDDRLVLALVRDEAPEPADHPQLAFVDAHDSPARAAAEAVTARLETLFPDTDGDEAATDPEPAPVLSESPPEPQAAPDPEPQPEPDPVAEPQAEPSLAADLSLPPEIGFGFAPAQADEAPYPFRHPIVAQPKASPPGLASLLALAAIGLAFFAGGVFWGTHATAATFDTAVTPQLVGFLAGAAGALMFCVAVYLLLRRLARAAEDGEAG